MRLRKDHINKLEGSFVETLNIRFVETDDDKELIATMPVTKNLLQISQVLHGGATISLAETVAGMASNTLCAEDEYALGIQVTANHLSSGQLGDTMIAKALAIHLGRTTHLWNIDVYSEKSGRLVSTIRITNIIVKK